MIHREMELEQKRRMSLLPPEELVNPINEEDSNTHQIIEKEKIEGDDPFKLEEMSLYFKGEVLAALSKR